jgi:hypothetical protein
MTSAHDPQSCVHCGAPRQGREDRCTFCGGLLRGPDDDDLRVACRTFIEAMNKDLDDLATPRVVIGFVLAFAVIPVTYFVAKGFGAGLWEAVVCTVFIGLAAIVVAGVNLTAEQKRRFREVLRPQIDRFLTTHQMRREEFLVAAREALDKGSTLLGHIDDLYA